MKNLMKKYGLLMAMAICFALVVVLSWLVPTGTVSSGTFTNNGTEPVGIINLFRLPVLTVQTFIQYMIVLLAIGGLYGVLNKTGVYDNLVRTISKKWNGKEKALLIIVTVVYALLSSLTGLTMPLFATIPFVAAILMITGYDKLTVMLSTIGATLVGFAGSIFGFNGAGYIKNIFSISMTDEVITKIVVFVLFTGLFTYMVVKKATLNKGKGKDAATNDKIPFFESDYNNTRKALPMVIILVIFALLIFVGSYNWYYGWDLSVFNNFHTALNNIKIGDYPIVENILAGVSSLGYWGNYELAVAIVMLTCLVGWLYNVTFDDFVSGVKAGFKEMFPVALYGTLANIVFTVMLAGTGTMFATIVNALGGITDKFNLPIVTLMSAVGSFFYNDFYYLLTNASNVLAGYDAVYQPLIGVVSTGVFGLIMMILPTSVFLVIGLKYFNISLKEWLKNIWKFLLTAFVVLMLVAVVVMILI